MVPKLSDTLAPLGNGKIKKMKWCEGQLVKMKSKATLIAESGLKTCQCLMNSKHL
jgi:hypothetical protein